MKSSRTNQKPQVGPPSAKSPVPDLAKERIASKLFRHPDLADVADCSSEAGRKKIESFLTRLGRMEKGAAETLLPGACELACSAHVPFKLRDAALDELKRHGPILTNEIAKSLSAVTETERLTTDLMKKMNLLITNHYDNW